GTACGLRIRSSSQPIADGALTHAHPLGNSGLAHPKFAQRHDLLIAGQAFLSVSLLDPPRSMASIHRQVVEIAEKQGWKPPSYDRVRQIIKSIDPALVTYAHQGAAAYREEFDLLYRRDATHANAMWQADVRRIGGRK